MKMGEGVRDGGRGEEGGGHVYQDPPAVLNHIIIEKTTH